MREGLVAKTLRQEHTEQTRLALIGAATRLFAERGYDNTSIDELAAAARVTRGALYHHFSGKQDIFGAVCAAVDADVVNRVREAAATPGPARERLRRVLDVYFDASRDPAYQTIVLGEAHKLTPRDSEPHYTPAMSTVIGAFVRELAEAGEITVEDPDMLTRLLCATLHEVASAAGTQSQETEEYAKKIICHMLFGN
jgi:AcrR family transcriptional regulator